MKKSIRLLLLIQVMVGIVLLSSCGDDDAPPPADPTITLTANASDANRGQEVIITGTIEAPGGYSTTNFSVTGVEVSGVESGATGEQSFTATYTVPTSAEIDDQISIEITVVDNLQQEADATYTITVVSQGAPTIAISGNTTADLKRRAEGSVTLNISAPEGLTSLNVTDSDGNSVEDVQSADIADPSNYSYSFMVPDDATVDGTYVLNFNATDETGQTTTTAAVFTTTVLAFDAPTIAFKDLESGGSVGYSTGSDNTITFQVTKDELVAFGELQISKAVNDGDPDNTTVDISSETGAEIEYTLNVSESFLDEIQLTFRLDDEFDVNTESVELTVNVWTENGEAYIIEDVTVGSTDVKRVIGNINEAVTFAAANTYYLSGGVDVSDDGVLTIEAGTTVAMETGNGSSLDIDNSGMINAVGTSTNPIVFTSGASIEEGTPAPGDWSFVQIAGEAGQSSGSFQYVRIEYAGDGEPAFELDVVDDLTTISHVQIFKSGDMAMEVNGGDVTLKNLVITDADGISIELDDDDDNSYTGDMQYILIETTNILSKGARDFEIRDGSNPTVSNITLIGPGKDTGTEEDDVSGIRIRDDAGGLKFYNMIIAEYSDDGFRQDNVDNITDIDGDFVVAHSYIFQIEDQPTRDDNDDPVTMKPGALLYETDAGFVNTIDADNVPAAATGIGVSDFIPDAEITSSFDPTSLGANFSAGSYVGAFDGTTDWSAGWTLNADGSDRN